MTSTRPDIWVMVITYNQADFIDQCLASLVAQTLRPARIFVCDDCSTDGTWEAVRGWMDRHPGLVDGYRQPENLGAARHSVFLFDRIEGAQYAVIEGDDWWAPQKLEKEWEALQAHPDARIAYSNVMTTDAQGKPIDVWHDPATPLPGGNVFYRIAMRQIFNRSGNCCRNYLVETACLREIGYRHDTSLPSLNDYDVHLTLSSRFPFAGSATSEPMIFYRRHGSGMSADREAVGQAGEMVYAKHDAEFAALPPAQEILARLQQEAGIVGSRDLLPPAKQKRYAPGAVLGRLKQRLMNLPDRERIEVWKGGLSLFRRLALQQAADALAEGRDADALQAWLEHYQNDPHPLDAWFALPPELYARLQGAYATWKQAQG